MSKIEKKEMVTAQDSKQTQSNSFMEEFIEELHSSYRSCCRDAFYEYEYFPMYEPDNEQNWPTRFGHCDTFGDLDLGWMIDVSSETPDTLSVKYKNHDIGEFTYEMVFGEYSSPALIEYIDKAIKQIDKDDNFEF